MSTCGSVHGIEDGASGVVSPIIALLEVYPCWLLDVSVAVRQGAADRERYRPQGRARHFVICIPDFAQRGSQGRTEIHRISIGINIDRGLRNGYLNLTKLSHRLSAYIFQP